MARRRLQSIFLVFAFEGKSQEKLIAKLTEKLGEEGFNVKSALKDQ